MLFVDGENFTIRGQAMAKAGGFKLEQGAYWNPDAFLWVRNVPPAMFLWAGELSQSGGMMPANYGQAAIRCYYYTGVKGDDDKLHMVSTSLRQLGFDAQVFKRSKPEQRTKAVDISLATEILGLAHQEAFDIALLVAGDQDYVPLVRAVKRTGKRVFISFFTGYPDAGLSDELKLEADLFLDLTALFQANAHKA